MHRILFILGCSLLTCGAATGESVEGKCIAVARDRTGVVWSIDGERGSAIATLEGKRWKSRGIAGLGERCEPVGLESMPDGDVAGLWRESDEPDAWAVTRHRAGESRVWVRFRAELREPVLRGRRDGSAIITESGRHLLLLPAGGEPPFQAMLAPASFAASRAAGETAAPSDFAPVRAAEDAIGQLWLWSPQRERLTGQWRIPGVLRFNPAQRTETLIRIDDDEPPITQVVAWDQTHLAVAIAGKGVGLMPLDGSRLDLMPAPGGEAFRYLEQLFHDGSAWHAIATPQPTRSEFTDSQPIQGRLVLRQQRFYDGSKRVCALWQHGPGGWSLLYDGLDKDPSPEPRPWLRTATGLYLGADRGAPWFFPTASGSAPRRLAPDPRFPLPAVSQIVEAEASQVLLRERYGSRTCLWPADAPAVAEGGRTWEPLTTRGHALQDRRGRIWCFRDDGTFARWEDEKWIAVQSPEALRLGPAGFSADDRNRGWLLPADDGPTAVCDFATGEWHVFPSLQEALRAQLPQGVRLTVPEYPFHEPTFTADGRIGAFTGIDTVLLYETGAWRKWKLTEIIGKEARMTGTPFFAADGHFAIPIGERAVWMWLGAAGWGLTAVREMPSTGTAPRRAQIDGVDARREAGAVDRFGVAWWLRDRTQLSKSAWGRTVAVLAPGEANPFQHGGAIHAALTDAHGHTLLATTEFQDRREHVFMHPHRPAPRTTARLLGVRDDTARLALSAEPAEDAWFTWRLDRGEWRVAANDGELRLDALAAGEHRVQVRAWNADLIPDASGATISFRVEFETPALLRKLLAELTAADLDQREAAARSLTRLGRAALPAIEEARRDAGSDLRWWLDAVRQAIERHPER